jgi:hypothetical protein
MLAIVLAIDACGVVLPFAKRLFLRCVSGRVCGRRQASRLPASVMPTCANPGLVALLKRWTRATEDANYSSQQSQTFRKAAKALAAFPTPITTREEALKCKYVGEKIAGVIADWCVPSCTNSCMHAHAEG